MRFVRFFVSILIIFIVIFLFSLLLPSKVTVSKSVLINSSKTQVHQQVGDFQNWKNWYPAFQSENINVIINPPKPGIIKSVSLNDAKGKKLQFDLIKSRPDTLDIKLRNQSLTKIEYQFILSSHSDGQTQLTWNVNTTMKWYPWEKAKGIFLDKVSGPQYEAALLNLKRAVENKVQ
jgi:hypothetical protein